MSLSNLHTGMGISSTGLSAERLRMEVVAANIANAHSVGDVPGGAYRRQQVNFAAAVDQFGDSAKSLKGVRVLGVSDDNSPMEMVYDPGHVAANEEGFVQMPNVHIPLEMVDLVTASRAYEANLKSLQTMKQLAEESLSLLRGLG